MENQRSRLIQIENTVGSYVVTIGLWIYSINIAIFGYYEISNGLYLMFASNLIVLIFFFLVYAFRRYYLTKMQMAAVVSTLFAITIASLTVHSIVNHPDELVRVGALATALILTATTIGTCPDFRNRFYKRYTLAIGIAMASVALRTQLPLVNLIFCTIAIIVGLLIKRFFAYQVHRSLELETARSDLIKIRKEQKTRSEREKLHNEMEFARKIQDSFSAPKELRLASGMVLKTFHRGFEQVAGDWIAVRQITGGAIALVADAAGKGLQASLVIHALQSLWAGTLDDEVFDPVTWITHVNRVLFHLGKNEAHFVSLGMLVIHDNHIDFYGCGSPPIFFTSNRKDPITVRSTYGTANVLGFSTVFSVTPRRIEMPVGSQFDLLIGSDGLIDHRGLRKKRQILEFLDSLEHAGDKALATIEIDDDKSLIWLSRPLLQPQAERDAS